jgi:hypothetical protein
LWSWSTIKKTKMLAVDANCDEFRAAVADIIISLQPKPLETAHTGNVQNEVTGPRIHLRSRSHSFSVPSNKVKTNPHTHGGARAGAERKSKGSKTKSLQLRSKRFQKKKSATVSKLGNARKHSHQKIKLSQLRVERRESIKKLHVKFCEKLQRALNKNDFSNVFAANIAEVSKSQVLRLSKQVSALILYYRKKIHNSFLLKEVACKQVSAELPFSIHFKTIQRWVADFEEKDGKLRESMKGKHERTWILNETDLKNKAINF